MNLKNAGVLILVMAVQILCLGVYTNYVLKDVLVTAISTETTKVINTNNNDLKTKIDNNFKKINELNSNITTALPIKTNQENKVSPIYDNIYHKKDTVCIPNGYTLIKINNLTRRQRKRLFK